MEKEFVPGRKYELLNKMAANAPPVAEVIDIKEIDKVKKIMHSKLTPSDLLEVYDCE